MATATSQEHFDLVFMDVQMPEMDGFEATRHIREFEAANGRPRMPIVAMTAHAMKGDRERCFEAGMDGYISKPVRAAELSRIVAQFAPGKHPSPAAAKPSEPTVDTVVDTGVDEPPRARPSIDMDWSVALQNAGGDHDLLRSVAIAALDEWPTFVDQLRTAMASRDQTTIRRIAHTFKSAFRTLGAQDAYTLSDRLETAATTDDLAGYPLAELFEAIESVTVQLTTFVGKPQSV